MGGFAVARRAMTFRKRILAAFAVAALLLFGFTAVVVPQRLAREHAEQLRLAATSLVVVLSSQARNLPSLERTLTRVDDASDVAAVTLFGPGGEELAHAGERPFEVGDLPRRGHLEHEGPGYVAVQDAVELREGTGALRVVMTRAGFADRVTHFRPTQLLVGSVILMVGLLLALFLSRVVVRPIEKLTAGVNAVERGEASAVKAEGAPEVHTLAEAINTMREEVAKSHEELARAARRARLRADELERANVDLDGFAYAASHDLRAPLRGIAHLADFISEDLQDVDGIADETREHLLLLRRRVERLDHLLDSLLEHSRAGHVDDAPEEVDLGELVGEVIDLLAIPEGFEVITNPMPSIVTVRAPLQRVFVHLVGNAIKHHDRTVGKVHIGCSRDDLFTTFTVSDDGPGIPAELQEKAFRIFHTLKRRDEVEGAGMGLALIKKTVEGVGGELSLESEGRGCTFVVRWPHDLNTTRGD